MGPGVVILLVAFVVCLLVGGLWAGLRRQPRRKAAAPKRRARKAAQVPAVRAGATDTERVAWVVGKMTATPPREVPADVILRELLAKVDHREFATAVGRELRTEVVLDAESLGLTVAQFARYARGLRKARRPAPARRRRPAVADDVLRGLPPPLLALATELGVRGEWDLEKSRRHLTQEYLRWNARIHLAGKEAERAAVQERLEQIGRLREALAAR